MRRRDGNPVNRKGCRGALNTGATGMESAITAPIRRFFVMAGMGSTMTNRIPINPRGTTKWRLLKFFNLLETAEFSATLIALRISPPCRWCSEI
jgi:hypothetical protein